jgi:hypothetical protein
MGSGLINCAKCDKLYSDKMGQCPHCRSAVVSSPGGPSGAVLGIVTLIAAVAMLAGVRACTLRNSATDSAALDRDIAKTEAENEAKAKDMGVSLADYMSAKAASTDAYAECKVAAEGRAKHDYKADFLPSSTWTVKGRTISVVGRDLQMQNGFGAYGPVTYFCDWDMDMRAVKSLTLSED